MNDAINIIGKTIILGKYALVLLLAGFTLTSGATALDPVLILGFESND